MQKEKHTSETYSKVFSHPDEQDDFDRTNALIPKFADREKNVFRLEEMSCFWFVFRISELKPKVS